jgi:hypothetical protein
MIQASSTSGVETPVFDKEPTFVRFVSPEQLAMTNVIGYDMQKRAAVAVGLHALPYGEKRLLVFGLPGSGVRRFVENVLWELNEKYATHVFLIDLSCENLILASDIEKTIRSISRRIEEELERNIRKGNSIVFLVERPESFSSKFQNFQSNKRAAILWLSFFLRKVYDKTLIICTSDDPSSIDALVLRTFNIPIYLRHLNLESLTQILATTLKRRDYSEIAKYLYDDVEKNHFKLVSAEVVKAIERASDLIESIPIDQAAKCIRRHIYPCYPSTYVDDYEERNESLISHFSTFVLNCWSKRMEELEKNRKIFSSQPNPTEG